MTGPPSGWSFLRLLAAIRLLTLNATFGQVPPTERIAPPPSGATVLHAVTQLVIVEVTLEDKNVILSAASNARRSPHRKQAATDRISLRGALQTPPEAGPELPPMPSGTFTAYTSVRPSGALNILLLDTLNDQVYVPNQLRQIAKKAKPGTRVVIFGSLRDYFCCRVSALIRRCVKNAVEHKMLGGASNLLMTRAEADDGAEAASDNGPSSSVLCSTTVTDAC